MAHQTCLIATVKDEAPWLLEWLAHNLALGFDRIVVASNDCTDGTDRMLDRLQALGLVRHDPNWPPYGGDTIQFAAYQRMRRLPEVANAEWVMALDADEFLCVHLGDGTLAPLLAAAPAEADLIQVAWRLFGDSELSGWIDAQLTEAFVMAEAPGERPAFVKSLVRGHHRVANWGVHVPRYQADNPPEHQPRFTPVLAGGRRLDPAIQDAQWLFMRRPPDPALWDAAQVNHYMLKTREMYALKMARGGAHGAPVEDQVQRFADLWESNHNDVHDTSAARLAPARGAWMARLLSDPQLAALHEWTRARARAQVAAA